MQADAWALFHTSVVFFFFLKSLKVPVRATAS